MVDLDFGHGKLLQTAHSKDKSLISRANKKGRQVFLASRRTLSLFNVLTLKTLFNINIKNTFKIL